MIDLIRRSFLVGLGAIALTRDRLEQFVGDSVARGELSTEQGKSLLEEMTQRAESERQRMETFVRQQVDRALEAAGLIPRAELTRLEDRIQSLERQVRDLSMHQSSSAVVLTPSAASEQPTSSPGIAPIALDPISNGPDIEGPGLPPHM